ncbi:hypothetical protein BST61_g7977 [Cercospora zeina]
MRITTKGLKISAALEASRKPFLHPADHVLATPSQTRIATLTWLATFLKYGSLRNWLLCIFGLLQQLEVQSSTIWDNVWQEAAQLQQNGVTIMMMLGGAAPRSYPRLCGGPKGSINESYYVPLRDTLKHHKIQGLDLDIEERVPYTCSLNLLHRLHSDFGPDFILTMAPVASELQPSAIGLGGFSYKTLDAEATASNKPNGKLVSWYNAQFYNGWGDASRPNGYDAIIANGWSADRVAMGVLASSDDVGSGWYGISTYQNTFAKLKAKHADFGSVLGWEYWDAGSKDGFGEPWQWVAAAGKSVFAAAAGAARPRTIDTRDEDFDSGPSPWPVLTERLEALGVGRLSAVRALNISDGSWLDALQELGLSDILPL